MSTPVAAGVVAAGVVALVLAVLAGKQTPEIRRYLKMRSM
jgi:hypothetical protein